MGVEQQHDLLVAAAAGPAHGRGVPVRTVHVHVAVLEAPAHAGDVARLGAVAERLRLDALVRAARTALNSRSCRPRVAVAARRLESEAPPAPALPALPAPAAGFEVVSRISAKTTPDAPSW